MKQRDTRQWLPTNEYEDRLEAVRIRKVPACATRGPKHARCVREPGHGGDHEGPGYDAFGPLYRRWN